MEIVTFPLGELQANSYLLIEDNECIIIDPADDAAFLLEELSRRNVKLKAMLATHGHFDHVMAAGEIHLSLEVPLFIFEEDQFLLDRLDSTAKHFLGYEPHIIKPTKVEYLNEGPMKIGEFAFEVIHTPGHTPGSACFYFSHVRTGHDLSLLFTGDTLFKDSIGDYSHRYSNKADLLDSIEKIRELARDAEMYPGHGESTLL